MLRALLRASANDIKIRAYISTSFITRPILSNNDVAKRRSRRSLFSLMSKVNTEPRFNDRKVARDRVKSDITAYRHLNSSRRTVKNRKKRLFSFSLSVVPTRAARGDDRCFATQSVTSVLDADRIAPFFSLSMHRVRDV